MNETDIVNGALALLKAGRILSLTDGTPAAQLASTRYAACRDVVLELAPWNFADVYATLTRSTTLPVMRWGYYYPLPTDPWCLKVRDPDPHYTPWQIGYHPQLGRVLMTNAQTMQIRYTARITDLNIWSPLAAQALTYLLASDLAMPITGSTEKATVWYKAYQAVITEATFSDAQEGSPVIVQAPTHLTRIR